MDATHSSMSSDSIEAQACFDDWMKVEFQRQKIDQEPTYEFFKYDQTTDTKGSDD